ncbi:MAG: D-amino acid dehydrogenase [Rubrivivax sp.]
MRVAVIGAGIVGVTAAFELAADGHDVTVFERNAGVASETSFANAGVLAPGYVTPWAAPGMPLKVLRHLFGRHAPVRFGGIGALAYLPWIWRWWRACRPGVYQANRSQMVGLARFSSQRLHELTQSMNLEFEQARGVLVLLRSAHDLAQAQATLRVLGELQMNFELLDAAQCHSLEPGLNADMPLTAGIALPRDEVGNCRQFAQLMKAQAQAHGARFLFQHDVHALVSGAAPRLLARDLRASASVHAARTEGPVVEADFDGVVVCAGHQANRLLGPLGLGLPIIAVHGYSVTAPLQQREGCPAAGPRAAVMDEKYKIAISRLGQRIRVAGSAELGGPSDTFSDAALATLYKVLEDWFPGAARLSKAQRWKGARPMLPDGPPVIGPSPAAGIWLNLGHGSSGWALACGSARVLADLIARREPAIDITHLAQNRFKR